MEQFDFEAHEARVSERYRQIARIKAFDFLVDMALDGVITMTQAIEEFKADDAEQKAI